MNRRTFLRSATLGAVAPSRRPDAWVLDESPREPDDVDEAITRGLDGGHYRLLGMIPETDQVVVSVERAADGQATLTVHTIEQYTTPGLVAEPSVRAPIRAPTIHVLGRTPYRVVLLPDCEGTPPSSTTFIRFAAALSLGVHLRRYQAVDEIVLVEDRTDTDATKDHPSSLPGTWDDGMLMSDRDRRRIAPDAGPGA